MNKNWISYFGCEIVKPKKKKINTFIKIHTRNLSFSNEETRHFKYINWIFEIISFVGFLEIRILFHTHRIILRIKRIIFVKIKDYMVSKNLN